MNKTAKGPVALIAVLAATVVFCVAGWVGYESGLVHFDQPVDVPAQSAAAVPQTSEATITLVCEATHSMPVNGFDAPPRVQTKTIIVGLEFEAKTGWYQGDLVLSEARKGSLTQKDGKILVSRPAMFERFGTMVTGEQFTVVRATGEFQQTLFLKGDRSFDLIKGYCGRLIKAPL